MRPTSRKRENARENGRANDRSVRINEKFCEALAQFMGQEKLIDFIRFLHELEETRPRINQVNFSKTRKESGNGKTPR